MYFASRHEVHLAVDESEKSVIYSSSLYSQFVSQAGDEGGFSSAVRNSYRIFFCFLFYRRIYQKYIYRWLTYRSQTLDVRYSWKSKPFLSKLSPSAKETRFILLPLRSDQAVKHGLRRRSNAVSILESE